MIKRQVCEILEKIFDRNILPHQTKCISLKSLFGGYGIRYNGMMFARIYQQKLFLKAYPQIMAIFVEQKMEQLEVSTGVTLKKMQYYKVTNQLWANQKALVQMLEIILELSYQDRFLKKQCKESRIKDMPNMTVSLERLLFKIGVISIDKFRELGAHEVYFQLSELKKDISSKVFFILHSALMGVHVEVLTIPQKKSLSDEFELLYKQQIDKNNKGSFKI